MARVKTYPDDLRDRLVAESFERLRHEHPDTVSLRELAASCGTSTNAIYSIFGGKDALIDQVCREARAEFAGPHYRLALEEPSLAVLAQSGTLSRSWAHANPALYRLIFNAGSTTGRSVLNDEWFHPIRLLLQRLIDHGVLRPHDTREMALSLWASTHGFVLLEMDVWPPGVLDTDRLYEAHLRNSIGTLLDPEALHA